MHGQVLLVYQHVRTYLIQGRLAGLGQQLAEESRHPTGRAEAFSMISASMLIASTPSRSLLQTLLLFTTADVTAPSSQVAFSEGTYVGARLNLWCRPALHSWHMSARAFSHEQVSCKDSSEDRRTRHHNRCRGNSCIMINVRLSGENDSHGQLQESNPGVPGMRGTSQNKIIRAGGRGRGRRAGVPGYVVLGGP